MHTSISTVSVGVSAEAVEFSRYFLFFASIAYSCAGERPVVSCSSYWWTVQNNVLYWNATWSSVWSPSLLWIARNAFSGWLVEAAAMLHWPYRCSTFFFNGLIKLLLYIYTTKKKILLPAMKRQTILTTLGKPRPLWRLTMHYHRIDASSVLYRRLYSFSATAAASHEKGVRLLVSNVPWDVDTEEFTQFLKKQTQSLKHAEICFHQTQSLGYGYVWWYMHGY